MHPSETGLVMTPWGKVAKYLRRVVGRLEDENEEGAGIVKDGARPVDISSKSEPWRRGYFQALMGLARAAENLEGWVTDTKKDITAPAECMVGPSNPHPRPIPEVFKNKTPPREEDCEPASPSPKVYYDRIMTTRGFSTRQKVDAALAYADWLDYKDLAAEADDVYKWAMDTAASALPHAANVVDIKTGVVKDLDGKDLPSENVLRVSTSWAVHDARQGNLSPALSIFASILKARQNLVHLDPEPKTKRTRRESNVSHSDPIVQLVRYLEVLIPVEYPPPSPSGNSPPNQHRTNKSVCEEAELMTYIGEIIFASSSHKDGLSWTRNAVDLAEEAFLSPEESDGDEQDAQRKCGECLKVGLENWSTMLKKCISLAEKKESESKNRAAASWIPGYNRQVRASERERSLLQAEKVIVDDRAKELWPALAGVSMLDLFSPWRSSPF